jgi:hypothetical protein
MATLFLKKHILTAEIKTADDNWICFLLTITATKVPEPSTSC